MDVDSVLDSFNMEQQDSRLTWDVLALSNHFLIRLNNPDGLRLDLVCYSMRDPMKGCLLPHGKRISQDTKRLGQSNNFFGVLPRGQQYRLGTHDGFTITT